MAPRIDAHQHFWQRGRFDDAWLDAPGREPLCRDHLPEHLAPELEAAGVDRTVAVQTLHDPAETRWLLELAERYPSIAGVVGWLDLRADDREARLEELTSHPKLVGVRHLVQDEPDPDFAVRPDVLAGLRVLEKYRVPFDLLFRVEHLRHAATLAAALPDLPLVLDHLGKPAVAAGRLDDWLPHLRAAARWPNVWCKLSGLVTEADRRAWRPTDLRPYLDAALEAFGPERCLFGSDWPVCKLAATYGQVRDALVDAIAGLSASEQARILGGTAVEVYGL